MLKESKELTSKKKIFKELRRAIIMGHHRPGQRLDVINIANQYSISITPVRDALNMLNQEGLVTIKPRSGYFVTPITLKELRDMLDLRNILELAAVERAVHRITAEQIAAMREVHAGYTGDDDESYDRYTDENRHFHYLLAQASGNRELAEMLGHLLDRLARFMVLRRGGRSQEASHANIIAALEAHDSPSSRQALLDDIEPSKEAIIERVIEEEADSWIL
ncbi:MAG: GntR family transcriptional regulator [Anaerolineales bacterium]|nr:GntR family transcriptional regulator [Anaerolineales bacterium]